MDLPARRMVVHTEPGPDGYRTVRSAHPGDVLHPTALPDVAVPVAAPLGGA